RTFHFSNGRGLEDNGCCCSIKHCALFHSVIFSLLFIVSLVLSLLAPVEIEVAERITVCTLFSIALLCSVIAPIGIFRRSSIFLAPFISLLIILLALAITLIIASVIYSIMQKESLSRLIVDTVLDSRLIDQLVLCLFGSEAASHPSAFHRNFILSVSLLIFFSLLFLVIQALFVTLILWRRLFCTVSETDSDSMDWMFAHLNGSYSTTVKRVPQFEMREWRRTTYISMDDILDVTH
ncbi:hypothetical protein PMAYCL1PPCAC_03479, partial [Pristionchus mayeri]